MSRILPTFVALVLFFATSLLAAGPTSPADELKLMQGNWKVKSYIGGAKTLFGETPEIIQTLGNDRLDFKIEENRLSFNCIRTIRGETLTLNNDIPLKQQQEQVQASVRGERLLMLKQEDGQEWLASYKFSGDQLAIRYPAGCCSRSGNVIFFERQK